MRDYCKLHIIFHYVSVLLGAQPSGDPFRVLPIGKVGADAAGERMLKEMSAAGMDVRFVDTATDRPTLLSVCFQYPDGAGGNITTTGSAASTLAAGDLDPAARFLASLDGGYLAICAPEVPLESRKRLLEIASRHGAFRAASFTRAEIPAARAAGMFELLNLVALNEDEASSFGGKFHAEAPEPFLESCRQALAGHNPGNLTFEFDNAPDAEIRITFDPNDGAWSYIGTDCKSIPRDQPTMNLGFLDGGTAAHEFGHAIGCAHEHQNPKGGIEWNEEVVLRDLAGPPNFWTPDQIRHNVLEKYSADQIRGTDVRPRFNHALLLSRQLGEEWRGYQGQRCAVDVGQGLYRQ